MRRIICMKKKLISLALLAGIILSSFTGCGASDDTTEDALAEASTKTATVTLTAITGDSTTEAAIEAVQKAINKLTKADLKTQVILQLKTEDEYVEFIESQVEKIEAEIAAEEEAEKKAKEEKKAKKEAEKLANANKKNRTKWTTTTTADTEESTADTQEMTLDEYGREVAKYPDLEGTSLDIIFITGADMLKDFVEKEYIQSIDSELTGGSKILNKYIYPTFLSAGKVEGSTYAIVNNRLIGEYTYLLIDRELAVQHMFNAAAVKTLADCEPLLDAVKKNNPDVVPINEIPELNYLQYPTDDTGLIGSIIKSNHTSANKAVPKNLLKQESYVNHTILADKLEKGGYVGTGDAYAVEVRKGYINTPEEENWEEKYVVVEYEKPIGTEDVIYSGMFAISSYASDVKRCMEIVTMLNTDGALRDIYAFGVEGENFEYNEDGTVHMLNDDWSMDFYHSGNTLVGSVPETLPANYATIAKQQNVESLMSPYFGWDYINEDTEAIYADYMEESESLLEELLAANDPLAWAKACAEQLDGDKLNPISVMLDKENDDGFVVSYTEFYDENNPS